MSSFDGAEICELVGLFILNHLRTRFGKWNIGLYRNDGLAIIKSKFARLLDKNMGVNPGGDASPPQFLEWGDEYIIIPPPPFNKFNEILFLGNLKT
jgi:hypothetical protein